MSKNGRDIAILVILFILTQIEDVLHCLDYTISTVPVPCLPTEEPWGIFGVPNGGLGG